MSWIISHFHHIHGFEHDPAYTDDMPRAAKYIFHRGNHKVLLYRVYLDRTNHDDIKWMPFVDHRDVVPFDHISLYSGWLACGFDMMVTYLLKRCMRQFGFVQMIPRSLF